MSLLYTNALVQHVNVGLFPIFYRWDTLDQVYILMVCIIMYLLCVILLLVVGRSISRLFHYIMLLMGPNDSIDVILSRCTAITLTHSLSLFTEFVG